MNRGFTLIELSIVMVIIGLIIGGILVGQDLIAAAQVRATISQVEKYQTAVNTFYGKYGGFPGDLPDPAATQFGFTPRPVCGGGSCANEGDGDGLIGFKNQPWQQLGFESTLFWVDLSTAKLIDGNFSTAQWGVISTYPPGVPGSMIDLYLPQAKIGNGNYFYEWEGGAANGGVGLSAQNGLNYFGLSAVSNLYGSSGDMSSGTTIPVHAAYNIDKKIDDGMPLTGSVTTQFVSAGVGWSPGGYPGYPGYDAANNTCIDTNSQSSSVVPFHYTLSVNGGAGNNCALSFQFQ